MTYRVTRNADQRPKVVLDGEPSYSTALEAAPPARETELNEGLWLVMAFAVWSVPDVVAIQTALDAAKHFEGKVKLGLRPFDSFEEFDTWSSETSDGSSPVWIVLSNGEKCWEHRGYVTVDALVDAIEICRDRADVLN